MRQEHQESEIIETIKHLAEWEQAHPGAGLDKPWWTGKSPLGYEDDRHLFAKPGYEDYYGIPLLRNHNAENAVYYEHNISYDGRYVDMRWFAHGYVSNGLTAPVKRFYGKNYNTIFHPSKDPGELAGREINNLSFEAGRAAKEAGWTFSDIHRSMNNMRVRKAKCPKRGGPYVPIP